MTTAKRRPNRFRLALQETERHKFKYGSRWFITEKERDEYKAYWNLFRRAGRAGYPQTDEGMAAFVKAENKFKAERELKEKIEAEELAERKRVREEFNLHPKANITRPGVVPHVVSTRYLANRNNQTMSAEQRIALIKSLYDDKTNTLADILIKTRQLVGADIETLKGRN